MDELRQNRVYKQLSLVIPAVILENEGLGLNEKLLLGLDYTLTVLKDGENRLSNVELSDLFQIHVNTVSSCRSRLVKDGYLLKNGRSYVLNWEVFDKGTYEDSRDIMLNYRVYCSHLLSSGAKLLWGEYNSLSMGKNEYFASREFTSNRLKVSEQSISKWTKVLFDKGFLKVYRLERSYEKSRKVVVTK